MSIPGLKHHLRAPKKRVFLYAGHHPFPKTLPAELVLDNDIGADTIRKDRLVNGKFSAKNLAFLGLASVEILDRYRLKVNVSRLWGNKVCGWHLSYLGVQT